MRLLSFEPVDFLPLLIFSVPIVAIAGGITAGIVRTIGQQRLLELAQRERIAAIERGVDPAKLPPAPGLFGDQLYLSPFEYARRRSQGLMIAGIVTLVVGVAVGVFVGLMAEEPKIWAVGLIPASVGLALLVCAWIVRPSHEDRGAPPPRAG